jgi:hypothetical protein
MRARNQQTASLGQLVAAAFDEASRYSTDPDEVARLATEVVAQLRKRSRAAFPRPSQASSAGAGSSS